MRTDNAECGHDKLTIKRNIIRMIQALPHHQRIDVMLLDAMLDRAFNEVREGFDDLQLRILDRILWHFFTGESEMWIGCRTQRGNLVTADVLITAYTMWHNAMCFADNHGVDRHKAASAMVRAVHITVDNLAKDHLVGDIRRYIFGIYRHKTARIIRKAGFADRNVALTEKRMADCGTVPNLIDNEILCRELLDAMPPMGQWVATLRFRFGYTWEETAKKTGTSVNAAQKALSVGCQRALEAFMLDGLSQTPGKGKRKISKKLRYKKAAIRRREAEK